MVELSADVDGAATDNRAATVNADVLRHTGDVNGSAFITDPKTGDAVRWRAPPRRS